MSKPKGFEIPVGVRDYLPRAVSKLRAIELNVLACMERWGYRQIMTPTMDTTIQWEWLVLLLIGSCLNCSTTGGLRWYFVLI